MYGTRLFEIKYKERILKMRFVILAILLSLSVTAAETGLSGKIAVKNGESISFLGDSITGLGSVKTPYLGYIHLVQDGLKQAGVEIKILTAGKGGDKSHMMLARVDKDVLAYKPSWVTVSCGVNDVWHGANGVPLEDYKKNMTALVDKLQRSGCKVLLMTASVITEDTQAPNNIKLKEYNAFLRTLAAEKKIPLADVNEAVWKEIRSPDLAGIKGLKVTVDGVHMNGAGNIAIASAVLEGFGMPESKIAEIRAGWDQKLTSFEGRAIYLTRGQYIALQKSADQAGARSVNEFIKSLVVEHLNKK